MGGTGINVGGSDPPRRAGTRVQGTPHIQAGGVLAPPEGGAERKGL